MSWYLIALPCFPQTPSVHGLQAASRAAALSDELRRASEENARLKGMLALREGDLKAAEASLRASAATGAEAAADKYQVACSCGSLALFTGL